MHIMKLIFPLIFFGRQRAQSFGSTLCRIPMDVFSKLSQLQWGCSTMEFHNFQDPSNIHGDAISPSTEICNKRSEEPE